MIVFGITSIIAAISVCICPETANKPLPQSIDDVEITGLALYVLPKLSLSLSKIFIFSPWGRSRPLKREEVESDNDMAENIALQTCSNQELA